MSDQQLSLYQAIIIETNSLTVAELVREFTKGGCAPITNEDPFARMALEHAGMVGAYRQFLADQNKRVLELTQEVQQLNEVVAQYRRAVSRG